MPRTETKPQAEIAPETLRLLETTIAHIDQGIAIFDAETRLTFCNAQYGQLLGFPPGFLEPGRTMMIDLVRAIVARGDFAFAGRDPEKVLAEAIQVLEHNTSERIVQRLYNGRWVQSNRKRIPGGYVFTLTDISATRAAEAELADTHRVLDAMIANADQGFAVYDRDLLLTFCNTQYVVLTGAPEGVVRAGHTRLIDVLRFLVARGDFPGRNAEEILVDTLEAVRTPGAVRMERRDTAGRCFEINRKAMPDGGLVITITDVTDARTAEAALAQAHRLQEATLASMDQGFAAYGADGVLLACNERHRELLGASAQEVRIGVTTIADVVLMLARRGAYGPGDPEALAGGRVEQLTAGVPTRYERDLRPGTWVQMNSNPLAGGGTVVTLTDVTPIKHAEQALAASRDEATRARQQLTDAIEAINDGFVLWDKDAKLVAFNSRYRDHHSYVPDMLKPGVAYEDVLREGARRGATPVSYGSADEWVAARLREHRNPRGAYLLQRRDGRWVISTESRTQDGGIVGIRTDVTRLRQSEEAAKAAERRLIEAIEAISEGFVLWDAQDRLVAFNARYRDQYSFAPDMLRPGVSYEEIIRESARRGVVPVGYDAEEWVRQRIAQHRNPGGAFLVQRKDGRWTMITEYRTQEGGIVGIRTDVTRMRASEEAAKAAQRRLMEAIEAVPQGFVIYDADDRIAVFNAKYRDRFTLAPDMIRVGVSFEELSRETLRRGLVKPAPADPEAWLKAHVAAHLAGTRRFIAHRGSRWLAVDEARTESGETVVIHADITELKQQERELRRSQRLLRGVIDAVPAVINVKDRHSRYLLMNRFQGDVYGVDPEGAIGKTSADFVGERYGGESNAMDDQVIKTGTALPWIERDFIDVKGRPHTWFTAKLPLRGEHGRIENVVTVALDITQLKVTERARTNLSRYVAPSLVEDLAGATEPFGPPRAQEIAIMFVDIVGSTAMIAREPIDSVFEFLRAFNGHLARTVFDHAGTLDKFTGDGIMATFGTPIAGEQDAANAIACARAIAAGLYDWNRARRAAGMTPVKVGIGVHWGEALMGTVGDEQRLEFSVIGDAVNVAHRLETLSRDLKCDIAASEAVVLKARAQGGDVEAFVPRGLQKIRGRADPVEVWSLTRDAATKAPE